MYRYIIRFKRLHAGDSPSRREIQAAVGIPSMSMVQRHLESLERAGLIIRPRRGDARRIAIPGAEWRFDEVTPRGDRRNKCAQSGDEAASALPGEERKMG